MIYWPLLLHQEFWGPGMGVRRGPFPLHVNKVLKFLPPQSRYDGQMVLHVATQNYSKFPIFSFFPSHKHFLGSNEVLINYF